MVRSFFVAHGTVASYRSGFATMSPNNRMASQYTRVPKQPPVLATSPGRTPIVSEALTATDTAQLVRGFKALCDPVRLRLLSLIASREGAELCVSELTEAFDVTGSTICHHLRVLREAGLIDSERCGVRVYYGVVWSALSALSQLLRTYAIPVPLLRTQR
jgi:ArsR family transcriptional regulator